MKKNTKTPFISKTATRLLVAGGLVLGAMGSHAAEAAKHGDPLVRYRVVLNDSGQEVQGYTINADLRKPHAYASTTKTSYRKAWDGENYQFDVVETGLRVMMTPIWQSSDGTAMLQMIVQYDDPATIRESDTKPPLDLVDTQGFDCQTTVMVPPGGDAVPVCAGGNKVLTVKRVAG